MILNGITIADKFDASINDSHVFATSGYTTIIPTSESEALVGYNRCKPRLSISGWYHAATAPEGSENATLTQLQTRASEDDDVAGFVPFQSAVDAVLAAAAAAKEDAKDDGDGGGDGGGGNGGSGGAGGVGGRNCTSHRQ